MTEGRHRPGRTRSLRSRRAQLAVAALLALLGFATAVQVRSNQQDNLGSLRQSDLVRILDDVSQRATRLQERARELEATRDRLSSGSGSSRAALDEALAREQTLGVLAGTLPATGPGIQFVVEDPSSSVTAAILLDTLEEMRDAGAEAVAIGAGGDTVRVVASTALVEPLDGRKGVLVDGTLLTPPYRFVVIGDPRTLAAALDIPGGVLDTLARKDATGTVAQRQTLTIDAVRPLPTPEYARPVPSSSAPASGSG